MGLEYPSSVENHTKEKHSKADETILKSNLIRGKYLTNPSPGEEVVITGMSGIFPSANNVQEFKEKLSNKECMLSEKPRWTFQHIEMPRYYGILPYVNKYDAGFFGVHARQADSLDPQSRLLQEKTIEAILDAGLHPSYFENSRTGVFVGLSLTESQRTWIFDRLNPQQYGIIGTMRSTMANRLSYFLKLKGPSFVLDTGCSSSLIAIESAYTAIRSGEIDNAIVAGTNVCLHPFMTLQFARLGTLSKKNFCMVFDEAADGYVRSEAIGVVLLQKQKEARRVYAEVLYAKTNCDGFKEQGITYPSKEWQGNLLQEFYDECNVDRTRLSYVEAHGTGTVVGDPEECEAITNILTKNRRNPLLVGSVKSNIGHSESAAGICSLIKCIVAMESGIIPPNINYNTPRKAITGIQEGKLKVVTDNTTFQDTNGLIGISAFGFGGANSHVLLHWNEKKKINEGIPQDNLPRLVCVSGRTEEAVTTLLDDLKNNAFDAEHIALLHGSFTEHVHNHLYKGYSIVSKAGEICRSINYFFEDNTELDLVFGNIARWDSIAREFINIPIFANTIERLQQYVPKHGINILDAIIHEKCIDSNNVLGNFSVQIAFVTILQELNIFPKFYFGHSFGKIMAAYYNKELTLEETINYALIIDDVLNKQSVKGKEIVKAVEELQFNTTDLEERVNLQKLVSILTTNKKPCIKEHSLTKKYVLLQIGALPSLKFEECVVLPIFTEDSINHFTEALEILGSLHQVGFSPHLTKLYPEVTLPVSRGTRMISPYIKWKHDRDWFVMAYAQTANELTPGSRIVNVLASDPEWSFIEGHIVDGKVLFPAAGYLYLVWETLVIMYSVPIKRSVVFENCRFIRAVAFKKKGRLRFEISIQKHSGNFEIVESNTPVVTGRIYSCEDEDIKGYNTYEPVTVQKHVALPLKSKDIYKELRLRGYEFRGLYRDLQECDNSASKGYIKWQKKWITFLDNMFQMKILQIDSRALYIPTFITKVIIPVKSHLEWINNTYGDCEETNPILEVYCDRVTNVIRCGKVEISGVIVRPTERKRDTNQPVLECYKFVPNNTNLRIEESVRVNLQIILENTLVHSIKCVELIDNASKSNSFLIPIVKDVLGDIPLVQASLKILSKVPINILGVDVEDRELRTETDCLLVIATRVLGRPEVLKDAFGATKGKGYVISREPLDINLSNTHQGVNVLTVHRTPKECLILLQKAQEKQVVYQQVKSTEDFSWISELQGKILDNPKRDVIIYGSEPISGIIGLTKCLRREPRSVNIRCLFALNKVKKFDPTDSLFTEQLKKNMAMNIYQNGQWGTYRHLLLPDSSPVEREHCLINVAVRGDLSSLKWVEGPLTSKTEELTGSKLVYVHYSALNFRYIMTALGKIPHPDVITADRRKQACIQGLEFSGIDRNGCRVMGITNQAALSTLICSNSEMMFNVPDSWTLEDAATVPVVYMTVIYAFYEMANLTKGETILIHSGSGGVGQAAIRVALHLGCKVFTTVGNQEKREFLKKTFPQLEDSCIGNSHDESFEQMVQRETKGRGVDVVLNSLAETKLIASLRCLARGGRFLEIGNFDMSVNSYMNLLLLEKEISFHGIVLDLLLKESPHKKEKLTEIMEHLIKIGVVKPLNRKVFDVTEVEAAFKYMASGKHMGKVLIKIRDSEKCKAPQVRRYQCQPRYVCDPSKVYIIIGGLGGVGLELADWLVLRGALKIVLTSRKGISTGYQNYRVRIWQSYGVLVQISKADVTTKSGCQQLIKESEELGPIDAIFNLAVVLQYEIFENQNKEKFSTAFGPKAFATEHLDDLTRRFCPHLRNFVVFSSTSCGRGYYGHTNYGMSNSIMEKICEDRKRNGYPALAIQWGVIGQVGIVAEMQDSNTETVIGGTLHQRISSCLKALDRFLTQDETIVSSMVVAEKRENHAADNIVDAVISVLGINNASSVSPYATLAEIGMDSLTAVDIRQTLEQDFDVVLTPKEMRTMTLARLKEIQEEKYAQDKNTVKKIENRQTFDMKTMLRLVGNQFESLMPQIRLKSKIDEHVSAPKVLFFPGIEGSAKSYETLALRLNAHVVCLQYTSDGKEETILDMAKTLLPYIEEHVTKYKPFNIVAFSFGVLVALEVVGILESKGYIGKMICIDGAPLMLKGMVKKINIRSETCFQTAIICQILILFLPQEVVAKNKEQFYMLSWEERLNMAIKLTNPESPSEESYRKDLSNRVYARLRATWSYCPSFEKIRAKSKLYKPKVTTVEGLADDYGMASLFENAVEVQVFEGNHINVVDNEKLAEGIEEFVNENL